MSSKPATTTAPAAASKSRSRPKPAPKSLIVKFKLPSAFLRTLSTAPVTTEPVAKPSSSSSSADQTVASNSSPPTEVKAETTPIPIAPNGPTAMLPPTETIKKKAAPRGQKRNSGALGDSTPRPRGKPGPKKKPRLDDGTIDHSGTPTTAPRATGGSHKLGPKANQGAINAGLRALDRSGKPCRKWQKGSFKLKSFTGVVWEIPRWRAPPKVIPMPEIDSSATPSGSGEGSGKENNVLASSALASDKSNSAGDIEMGSLVSSPAPAVVPA